MFSNECDFIEYKTLDSHCTVHYIDFRFTSNYLFNYFHCLDGLSH
jgi:hypothetical protein